MESQKIVQLLITFVFFLISSVNSASDKGMGIQTEQLLRTEGSLIIYISFYIAYKGPTTTTAGINLIKEHEGFHPNFYTDSTVSIQEYFFPIQISIFHFFRKTNSLVMAMYVQQNYVINYVLP